jgi:DNA primase
MIPKSFVETLVQKTDIESLIKQYVALTQVGAQLKGKCPFCRSPLFTVSRSKQIYKCFSCKKGGGVLTFVQELEKKSYPDAVKFLADLHGMVVPVSSI